MKRSIIFLNVVFVLIGCSQPEKIDSKLSNFNKTISFYDQLIQSKEMDIASLNQFMTEMPKGGDIHHHYTGTIYAETYLDWVKSKKWRINPCNFKIDTNRVIRTTDHCQSLTVDQLIKDNTIYRELLERWSDKDYGNHDHNQPAPDENFFNTFGYFGAVSDQAMNLGLEIIKERAIKENVSYIETMLTMVDVKGSDYLKKSKIDSLNTRLRMAENQVEVNGVLKEIDRLYFLAGNVITKVEKFNETIANNHKGIDSEGFKMRYQTYAARVLPPLQVYTSLLSGFYASTIQKDSLLVGVNIVAPENNDVALKDYTLHMRMFNYLHNKYPKVNRALHAGELTLGMVRPKNLLFHINEAITVAKAQRIGHGVDIPYESNSYAILDRMKQNNTVVEINLTSNQFILGVEGNKHPYLIYSKNNIPLVIATDDSGVSRNNLTNEYVLLASRYKPSYKTIKKYVRNSIKYSFLAKKDKKESLKILDNKFIEFEKMISSRM